MTCRTARAPQPIACIELAICAACGSPNLEVCSTARISGPHLCASCTPANRTHEMSRHKPKSREGGPGPDAGPRDQELEAAREKDARWHAPAAGER